MNKEFHLRILTETIVFAALSVVLYNIRIYTLPMGGSLTAGSMVPIFWLSLRRGARTGIEAGVVLGFVVMIIEPFLFHPVQVLLDYLIPFGVLGLAGLFRTRPLVGVAVGMSGRFISHFLSGIIFAEIYIPAGEHPVIYSVLYNSTYLIPELIISSVIIYLLAKRKLLEIYL